MTDKREWQIMPFQPLSYWDFYQPIVSTTGKEQSEAVSQVLCNFVGLLTIY